MKAHLMYCDRDFDPKGEVWSNAEALAHRRSKRRSDNTMDWELPPNAEALTQDLALDTLFSAMADGDEFLFHVARRAVLSGLREDAETILYRQAVLKDCLKNASIVKNIYDIAVETIESKRQHWLGVFGHYPSGILYNAVELLHLGMEMLGRLRDIAGAHAGQFESEGFGAFFAMLKAELTDDYFAQINGLLKELKFDDGVLVSAAVGKGNQGADYVLCRQSEKPGWLQRLFKQGPPSYTFYLDARDEAGHRSVSELRDRGINLVANALAQSADHIVSFFTMLQTELAFYLGCVNLHRKLDQKNVPVCFPVPASPGAYRHMCVGLRDACLALSSDQQVVGNDMDGDGRKLFIITGANQGGKSVFLRSMGLAQLMMQGGMFVAAESFCADLCRGLFTHYKREEDATMERGKFEEELDRMSGIVDALAPDALLLFNESFAATNEREGSEVARQIVLAMLETRVKVFFVTHLYEFAHGLWQDGPDGALFLRAERRGNGQRTFKLHPGKPLQTSFGADLYEAIFTDGEARIATADAKLLLEGQTR